MLKFLYFSYYIELLKFLKFCKIIDFRNNNKRRNEKSNYWNKIIEIHNYDIFKILIKNILIKNYLLLKVLMFCQIKYMIYEL